MSVLQAAVLVLAFWADPGVAGEGPPIPSAADVITLNDGGVVLGQMVSTGRFSELTVLVRRAWAEAELPAQSNRWKRDVAERFRLARLAPRDRLFNSTRDRSSSVGSGPGDPITSWIDREQRRVSDPRPPRTVLMAVAFPREIVRSAVRRDSETSRLLRIGWRLGIDAVESLPVADLEDEIGHRVQVQVDDPVSVDVLLPLPNEPEAVWRARRATTEAFVGPLATVRPLPRLCFA